VTRRVRTWSWTAEQLFAEHGIAAVPLRDIGIAAGQKNHAAVQYHFGDRESLVREIVSFRATLSERLRVEMFADLVSRGQPRSATSCASSSCRWPLTWSGAERNRLLRSNTTGGSLPPVRPRRAS